MSSLTKNKINGGYRGNSQNPSEKAFVYFDGSDIFEIDKNVAKGFSQSPIHNFITIKNMWMDKSEEKYIKDSFKNMSELLRGRRPRCFVFHCSLKLNCSNFLLNSARLNSVCPRRT